MGAPRGELEQERAELGQAQASEEQAAAEAGRRLEASGTELEAARRKHEAQAEQLARLVGHADPEQWIELHAQIKAENSELRLEVP